VNLALQQSKEQPDTELFLLYYACLSSSEVEGNKRIVRGRVMELIGLQQPGE